MPISSFIEIRDRLCNVARQAVLDLRRSRPGERIYAFGLHTNDDCIGAHPVSNTEEAYQKATARNSSDGMFGSLSTVLNYRWSSDEWPGIYSDQLPAPDSGEDPWETMIETSSFREAWASIPGNNHQKFRSQMFRAMVDALNLLDREGLFGANSEREAIILLISISDSHDAGSLEIESAKLLNPRRVTNRALRTIPIPFRWIILAQYYWRRLTRGKIIAVSLSTQVAIAVK